MTIRPNIAQYPNGFSDGVTIRNVPILNTYSGQLWWVDASAAQIGDGKFNRPFATIDTAINHCAAGDTILVKEGHTETITAAAGIDADVAGIKVIGLGQGRRRPTISFTTADTADIDIDAANITFSNLVFDFTGVASLAAPIDVNAADFTLQGCELIQTSATNQGVKSIVTATGASRMRVIGNKILAPTAGATAAIDLVGTPDGVEIKDNVIIGDFATAAIMNATGAGNTLTNLLIEGNYIRNDNSGDFAIELVAACTGVIQHNTFATDAIATAVDWGSCAAFDNLYFDTSDTDSNATPIPTAQTTGGMDLQTIADRLGADADTNAIAAALYGAAGIATFPNAAAAADTVSIAEVLRWISEKQIPTRTAFAKADVTAATAWETGNSPVTIATVTGVVMCRVFGVVTNALTSTGTNGTLALGVSDNVALWIAATTADGTNFATNDVWVGPTTTTKGNLFNNTSGWALVSNDTIKVTIATNSMTAGGMTIYVEWMPVTTGATVA